MSDDDKPTEESSTDRLSIGPGDLWVEDEETGATERIGDIPEAARKRIEERNRNGTK
jgi:hypothetical protein